MKRQKKISPAPSPLVRPGKGLWGGRLLRFAALPSTNTWALAHAAELQNGDVIRALVQTQGRGRFERPWHAPARRALTFSFVMTNVAPEPATGVGMASALAVRDCLAALGLPALLKWPNDVLVHNRKIAGILCERDDSTGTTVTGIGLNVNLTRRDFRAIPRILFPATSMRLEAGREFSPAVILRKLLHHLSIHLQQTQTEGLPGIVARWTPHDALRGRRLAVQTPDHMIEGVCAGLNPDGSLKLTVAPGRTLALWSGDVTMCSPRLSPRAGGV
jgi:BirA family biotin operon repressor/biotin-[acetyl-CoA-carboxylase] ligase